MPPAPHLVDHCRGLTASTEDVKWGDNLVFSVGEKMFAIFDLPDCRTFSCKVEDEVFEQLTLLDGIEPAPYLARARWITFTDPGALPEDVQEELLCDAHRIVASKLSKRKQRALGLLED